MFGDDLRLQMYVDTPKQRLPPITAFYKYKQHWPGVKKSGVESSSLENIQDLRNFP